jgi:phosphoribosylamine--glycine ligase
MAGEDPRIMIFHAGTSRQGDACITKGGRVLGVTAVDRDLQNAVIAAYEAVNKIHFDGMHHRHDIGAKALNTAKQFHTRPESTQ